jgi:hypothetical protein
MTHENEAVLHRFISEGIVVDVEILTRREAKKRNKIYAEFNRPSRYEEAKQPVHISEILKDLYKSLQQALNS